MSLRYSFAAVLRLLRHQKGLTQSDISNTVAQSHVSQLESAKTTATIDVSCELASAMRMQPGSLITLALACYGQRTPRELLTDVLAELEELELADVVLNHQQQPTKTPAMIDAERKRDAIRALKREGATQAEAARQLGLPEATLRRLWHQVSDS
ncbi:helix-turn-helix domain-containing protein [Pseudomonas putida]|uniref:Transcriptional regulator n=1 Tax=Pseudomonas putida TaxID=303 RepID=A0A7V8EBY6_PSEPU|nr:helix-turn-helix transcriptional regulator [Pseudomonas putida]KAF0252045.1 transcriptional regulator [Pseudomonas putida]